MRPSLAGHSCVAQGSTGPVAYGQLLVGEDLSGKLVTEVRRLASASAVRHEAQVLLVDGPPGIGCPLIAAVADADLLVAVAEPTVSGAHDLTRLVELAARLGVEVRVVLNKADLSEEGAAAVRSLCDSLEICVVAEVPFDEGLADLRSVAAALASEPGSAASCGVALQRIEQAWQALQ